MLVGYGMMMDMGWQPDKVATLREGTLRSATKVHLQKSGSILR